MLCFFQIDCLNTWLFHSKKAKLTLFLPLISKIHNIFHFQLHKFNYYCKGKGQNSGFSFDLFSKHIMPLAIEYINSWLFCTMTKLVLFFLQFVTKMCNKFHDWLHKLVIPEHQSGKMHIFQDFQDMILFAIDNKFTIILQQNLFFLIFLKWYHYEWLCNG